MDNTKAVYTLGRLSRTQRRRFRAYLISDYFAVETVLANLGILLTEAIDAGTIGQLDRKGVWSALRDDAYNDVRFRKYLSDLQASILDFLYVETTRSQPVSRYAKVLDGVKALRTPRLIPTLVARLRSAVEQLTQRDSQYYLQRYKAEKLAYNILGSELHRGVGSNSVEIVESLDKFYIIEKLRIYCSVLGRQFFLAKDYDFRLIDEILHVIATSSLKSDPAIDIYARLVATYKKPGDEVNFTELVRQFKTHRSIFSKNEQEDIFKGIQNFLARGINSNRPQSLEQMVELYEYVLEEEIYTGSGELSPWSFKNALLAALRLGRYDWALNTLENYSHRLPKEYRDNALAFNYAQVYFYKQDFGLVLKHLQQVEYQDPAYALNSRNLLVAVHYELGQIEPLYSAINSFRTYLKRQRTLSNTVKAGYRALLSVTLRLAKIGNGSSRELDKVAAFLEANPSTVSRQWLQAKLDELRAGERSW